MMKQEHMQFFLIHKQNVEEVLNLQSIILLNASSFEPVPPFFLMQAPPFFLMQARPRFSSDIQIN